ncbi:50S ribosomal protein L19 [Candidatus Poribacteria bacterium]|nr:50S ribosomal protein L19 [Candidatus Poribacteria bacterium]
MNNIIKGIQAEFIKKDIPDFNPGDNIKVFMKIFEGDKSRIQAFEGLVIRKKRSGAGALFTVRRISFGVGVERTFLTNSPLIDKIKLVRKGKVRRAKLYYLRGKSGKDSRILEKESKTTAPLAETAAQ